MRSSGRNATYLGILIMSLALLLFTASRTFDLLQRFLPDGQAGWAYLGIVAFDGGLLGWSLFYAHGAKGQQRAIALLMVIVSLVAVSVSTLADLYLGASSKGLVSQLDQNTRLVILVAVGAIVLANVTAFFLVHITEPDRAKAIELEEARSVIYAETLRQIRAAAPQVAAQVAPDLTAKWVTEQAQEFVPGKTINLAPSTSLDPQMQYSGANLPAVRSQVQQKLARGSLQRP